LSQRWKTRFGRRALIPVLGCLSLLGLTAGAASAGATTQTFTYTGSEQTFTVPAGVSTVHVTAIGGRGGKAGAQGGSPAEVQGDLAVKPGQLLYVEVGGEGGGGSGPVNPGGFNGGGAGAGGGGGATDVRTAPRSAGLFPDTRLIVAAGGGGSGSFGTEGAGPGGDAGEAGGSIPNNEGGGAGTAGSGGSGGSGGCEFGLPGELGLGGAGGNCESSGIGGGGGGGGYFGGGGGGAGSSFGGGGGGGGSSLVPAGGKSAIASFSAAEVQVSYASAAVKPEVGRCVATTGGVYQNAACTTKATGSGKYEWQPWPFTKASFALTNGPATFKTAVSKTTISCVENTITGEYTAVQSATLNIAFSECKVLGPFGGQCTGEKASPGEIISAPLEAEFGLTDGATSPPSVGWRIHPVSGEEVLSFQCGGTHVSVTGSVIAAMTPVNKMSGSFKLNFSGSGGIQKPESFEGGEKRFLTLETALATEQVGLTMNDSIANERLLEIRATS
jgi:Glycine rich protein